MGGRKNFGLDRLSVLHGMAFGIFATSIFWMNAAERGDNYAFYCFILSAVMGIFTGFAAYNRVRSEKR